MIRREYEFLDFNSPMDDKTAAALVEEVSHREPERIIDVGCGWAELLLRILEAYPTATGLGIENDGRLTERAMKNASARGLLDRISFRTEISPTDQSDVALCVGSEHVFGSLEEALRGLRAFVTQGGTLLLGTLFWEQPPTSELTADFAEVEELDAVIATAESSGWVPVSYTHLTLPTTPYV